MNLKPEELVKALRCTATPGGPTGDCETCPYYRRENLNDELKEKLGTDTWTSCDIDKVGMDAADHIERDQKEIEALRELAVADKEGRAIILPCKVGHRVFALLDTDKHISECEVKQIGLGNEIGFVGLEPIGARGREYGVALNGFGKTVFLTREEAEKALAEMEGK